MKQEHLSSDEVASTLRIQQQRDLAKDKLYPALVDATVSIDEAKLLLQSISTLLMEEALRVLQEKKMSDISAKMLKKLCPDGAREKEVSLLLDTLAEETLFDTRAQIEGMSNVIEFMIRSEMKDRTLNTFTPDWDLMMTK